LHLLQFSGPIRDAWRRSMSEAGLEVVTYVPDYGYLVWGDGPALERLARAAGLRWWGPYHPFYALHPALADPQKLPPQVDVIVQLYRHPNSAQAVQAILDQAQAVTRAPRPVLVYENLGVRIATEKLSWLVSLPEVVNVAPRPRHQMLDEVQDQIVAGHLDESGAQPAAPGYLAWLSGTLGFTTTASAYPIVDVSDDGIDSGSDTPLHPDFYFLGDAARPDRLVFNVNWTSDPDAGGQGGHGTVNASIVAAYNDQAGFPYQDEDGYRYGLGINPFGRVAGSKIFCSNGAWCLPDDDYTALISQTYALGGRISNNSWGCGVPWCAGDYDADAQLYDALVRDAQPGSASHTGNQEITILMAAGNDGAAANTVNSPATAKNVITVGAAESYRPTWSDGCGAGPSDADSAQDMAWTSSRGPTDDGRVKPELVAPGTHIHGAAAQAPAYDGGNICDPHHPAGQTLYAASSGTSHSTPAVAGAASLIARYYQDHLGQPPPSPAMLKAYLVNATRYLSGNGAGGDLPSNDQGYGEIHLGLAFDDATRVVVDQGRVFGNSGERDELRGTVSDPARPFRVTLAWTDAPGPTFADAYVNDLDLEVILGGQTYKGNVFSGTTSMTGGSADPRNNVESVFLPAGQSGPFTVRVLATNVAGDGLPGNADPTDQDFALVVYNGAQTLGYLDGVVYDASGGDGLPGASVQAVAGTLGYAATTNATGYYTLPLVPDTYAVSAWKYGYSLQTVSDVAVLSATVTTVNLGLNQTSLYSLGGCVSDATTGAPLAATVSAWGTWGNLITQTHTTQAGGCYTFALYGGAYTLTAQARLHLPTQALVDLHADATQNLSLTATTTDGLLWGHVTNLSTGQPVAQARVQTSAGLTHTRSKANGYYEVLLPPGQPHTVTISAPLYSAVTATHVIVPQSNLVERNYALPSAHVTLSPSQGLHVVLRWGEQTTRTLTVGNSGDNVLDLNVLEAFAAPPPDGPDAFGYTFRSSAEPGGPPFQWLDASDGTPLDLSDDGEANVTLPFPFTFYGTSSTDLRVGNNGGVLFGVTGGDVAATNTPLNTTSGDNLIAPLWDDVDDERGNVYFKTLATAPRRRFVVQWHERPHYQSGGGEGEATFQLILYEGSNNIKFQYRDVVWGDPAWDRGGSATVGIRQSGSNYLQYAYDAPVLADGMAICFQYPGAPPCDPPDVPWLNPSPLSHTLAASTTWPLSVVLDSVATTANGVYTGSLRFYNNDPENQPFVDYVVTMTVVNAHRLFLPVIVKD
jgi:hypothetical protein